MEYIHNISYSSNINYKNEINTNNSEYIESNMASKTEQTNTLPISIPVNKDEQTEIQSNESPIQSSSPSDTGEQISSYDWADLNLENIATNLDVAGKVKSGTKLDVVHKKFLVENNKILSGLTRRGQGRDVLISFLDHMFHQIVNNVEIIIKNIKMGINVTSNRNDLGNIIFKIVVYINNFENIACIYKEDTHSYSRLINNKAKYEAFYREIFTHIS